MIPVLPVAHPFLCLHDETRRDELRVVLGCSLMRMEDAGETMYALRHTTVYESRLKNDGWCVARNPQRKRSDCNIFYLFFDI